MKAAGFPICAADKETWRSFCDRMAHFINGDMREALKHCEWSGVVDGFFPDDKRGGAQEHWRDCSAIAYIRQGVESHLVCLSVVDHYTRWVLPVWSAKCFSPAVCQFIVARLTAWAGCNGLELPEWKNVDQS